MAIEFKELVLPRYISRDSDPTLLSALALYNRIKTKPYPGSPLNQLSLTFLNEFRDSRRTFVATDTDEVVAVANYNPLYSLRHHTAIDGLSVRPDHQGEGLGAFMLERLAERTLADGRERMRLRSVKTAIGFYAHLGFTPDEIVPVLPDEPWMSVDAKDFLDQRAASVPGDFRL